MPARGRGRTDVLNACLVNRARISPENRRRRVLRKRCMFVHETFLAAEASQLKNAGIYFVVSVKFRLYLQKGTRVFSGLSVRFFSTFVFFLINGMDIIK